jgi:hypothetical protein
MRMDGVQGIVELTSIVDQGMLYEIFRNTPDVLSFSMRGRFDLLS